MIGRRDTRPGAASAADDALQEMQAEPSLRMNLVLTWFMRVLSLIWLVKGLLAWALILGIFRGAAPFESASTGYQAGIVYFALIDLVAAIGLWLTSHWGGVLWLWAVTSHLILAIFFPRFVADSTLIIGLFILSIMFYLTIAWLASIEE